MVEILEVQHAPSKLLLERLNSMG